MNTVKIRCSLDRIINSRQFSEAESYRKLLSYLVEASLGEKSPKEAIIAYDVFGKDFSSTKSNDTTVRVYIHNLRQKLDSYYRGEGINDEIIFSIPKGHYQVNFKKNDKKPVKSLAAFRSLLIAAPLTLLVIWISIYYFLLRPDPKPVSPSLLKSSVWKEFQESELTTLLVFGDYFLYQDTSSIGSRYIRNFQINSVEEFNELMSRIPDGNQNYRLTANTFLGKFGLWCLNDLMKVFLYSDVNYQLRLASDLKWDDFNNHNIVFVGSFKTFRLLNEFLANVHFSYQVHPNQLQFRDIGRDSTFSFRAPKNEITGRVRDHGITAKIHGPRNNTLLLFASTHDVGHISMVSYFTDPTYLKRFDTNYWLNKDQPLYFEALFEVQGFERTGFYPNIRHFNIIEENK